MKSFLMVCGAIFLAVVILVGALVGFAAYKGSKLDASSKAYVDESVPAIVTNWSKEELWRRTSPQFRQVATEDQITQLFNKLGQLGALERYEGSTGQSNMNWDQSGQSITAVYKADAVFQNGKATIQIKLIQIQGAWQILGFHVDVPLIK